MNFPGRSGNGTGPPSLTSSRIRILSSIPSFRIFSEKAIVLFLIGDPKQAIYSFGADLFATSRPPFGLIAGTLTGTGVPNRD
jgi:hypothetical protein